MTDMCFSAGMVSLVRQFNDHPKPLSFGQNRSAPTVIPPGEGPLGPKETAFRWNGLTSLLSRGLDFWWYVVQRMLLLATDRLCIKGLFCF